MMFDRKALSVSLHALHDSDLKAGRDIEILKEAVGEIIDAIEASGAELNDADARHLAEAIDALGENQEFLARSSILLILEGTEAKGSLAHKPILGLGQLRDQLKAITL
jgi:hypothetical protein